MTSRRALAIAIAAAACGGGERHEPVVRSQMRFRGEGKHLAAMADGSVIVAGSFAMTTTIGGKRLTPADDRVHGMLARLARDGSVMWAKDAGGPFTNALLVDGDDFVVVEEAGDHNRVSRYHGDGSPVWEVQWDAAYPRGAAVDAAGNVYVVGTVGKPAGIGDQPLAPRGYQDIYVAAFDRTGHVSWAKTVGQRTGQAAYAAIATMGQQIVVATVRSTEDHQGEEGALVVLDPHGAEVHEVPFADVHLPPVVAGFRDGILLATDSPPRLTAFDHALQVRWKRDLGGRIAAIASDEHTITVAGQMLGRMHWGDATVTAADRHGDTFVGALRDDGTPTWVVHGAGKGVDFAADLVEADHRVWVTGAYDEALQLTGARDPLPAEGNGIQSGFVFALDLPRSQ